MPRKNEIAIFKEGADMYDQLVAEMVCFDIAWNQWLSCDNPYAVGDRLMIETDKDE